MRMTLTFLLLAGLVAGASAECTGCDNEGTCVAAGNSYTNNNCYVYKCKAKDTPELTGLKCSVNGACQSHGYTWTSSSSPCIRKKCVVETKGLYFSASQVIDKAGCQVNGACKNNGATWTENCFTKKCVVSGTKIWEEIVGAKCNVNGVCKNNGATWTEKCVTKKCVVSGNDYHTETSAIKCVDLNGVCRGNSDPPFPYVIGGKPYSCRCNATVNADGSYKTSYYGCTA